MTNVNWLYYDDETKQVEYTYSAANLSTSQNCEDKGLLRAIVPDGIVATRDHKVEVSDYITVDRDGYPLHLMAVISSVYSTNPVQPDHTDTRALAEARESRRSKLLALGLTQEEIDA